MLRSIHFQHGAEQGVCPLCTMAPARELPRRVTAAANAWHEDLAHGRQLRHHLRVMAGIARQSTTREAKSSCSPFDGCLHIDIRIRRLVGRAGDQLDRSLRFFSDVGRAPANPLGKPFELLGRKIAEFDGETDEPGITLAAFCKRFANSYVGAGDPDAKSLVRKRGFEPPRGCPH
jgi:hypothetical protein